MRPTAWLLLRRRHSACGRVRREGPAARRKDRSRARRRRRLGRRRQHLLRDRLLGWRWLGIVFLAEPLVEIDLRDPLHPLRRLPPAHGHPAHELDDIERLVAAGNLLEDVAHEGAYRLVPQRHVLVL